MTPQEQEQYDRIYCEVEDEARKEWVRQFGSARRFTPDSPALHRETERRLEQLAFTPRAVEMAYSLPIFEPQPSPPRPDARAETDRELLQLAAKAAGLVFEIFTDGRPIRRESDGQPVYWSPLANDGDALRLAVKLRLLVRTPSSGWRAFVESQDRQKGVNANSDDEALDDADDFAATRRAIVRAAAEIGKAMP